VSGSLLAADRHVPGATVVNFDSSYLAVFRIIDSRHVLICRTLLATGTPEPCLPAGKLEHGTFFLSKLQIYLFSTTFLNRTFLFNLTFPDRNLLIELICKQKAYFHS
jgi:hypothetical protein